jgi:hypothetical protein
VEKHGSESYFVLGEGLLTESVGGREPTLSAAAESLTAPFRFSRMGPSGINHQLSEANRKKVANAMAAGGGGAAQIPAGFTYLGQFTDHDLTFDRTSVTLGDSVSPADLLQARSPSLDLDSLYGAGPTDPGSAQFYEADGLHLRMGKTAAANGIPAKDGFDLPRGAGNTAAKKRLAIIPDPRNDENLAIAQTHLAFIRFHNRVVDTLPASVPASQRFAEARKLVIKHFQWMLRTDFLPRICSQGVVNDVFSHGRKAFEVNAPPTDVPTMPIEFSIAAYRLGHSMVRQAYNWNKVFDDRAGSLDLLFIFSSTGGDLGGETRLISTWIADFRRLYDFGEANKPNLVVPANKSNRAMRIDTLLSLPLKNLPPGSFGGPSVPFNDPRANLAFRNLTRAHMVKVASGQQMVRFLHSRGVRLTKLTDAQIRDGRSGAKLDGLTKSQRDALLKNTPLWFYVLREAEFNGGRLKGVGGRIVAETFHRAMEGSQASIVRDQSWRPTLGPNSNTFRMVDLLLFAFKGQKSLLAPLG